MSDRPTFEERLNDPLSHFPYKTEQALMHATDEAAEAEVYATEAYVQAQEAYLRGPSGETRQAERDAASALSEARRARRLERETQARQAAEAEQARQAELAQQAGAQIVADESQEG